MNVMPRLEISLEKILGGLTETQREAVTYGEGPLLVAAGPGSGKTRVIAHRIAYLAGSGVPPWAILAVTFTNKAAEEMRGRVRELCGETGCWISTFHSFCARILRREAPLLGYPSAYTIYDTADCKSMIQRILKRLEIDSTSFSPGAMLEAISRAKTKLLDPESYRAQGGSYREEMIAKVYQAYQTGLREAGAMDFDDLLNLTLLVFKKYPEALERATNRFKHVLIDEFQDTNVVQFELANLLAGTNGNILVVGDIDQSIYTWRGAHPRNVFEFLERHDQAKVIKLEENFRSTKTIVTAADELIRHNSIRLERSLTTSNDKGTAIEEAACSNETEEAEFVAERAASLLREGFAYSDMAVLYRTNAQSRALEEAFIGAKIPYRLVESVAFYQRAEIKDILAYLRLAMNPADELSFRRVANVPRRGVGKVTAEELVSRARSERCTLLEACERAASSGGSLASRRKGLKEFVEVIGEIGKLREGPVEAVLRLVISRTNYMKYLEEAHGESWKEKKENVEELVSAAADYDKRAEEPKLEEFLEQVALVSDADKYAPEVGAASLMTLHTAKGLEFGAVFIVGLEEGLLPHEHSSESPEEMEEERRLLYVGITRAKRRVLLSYARNRTLFGMYHARYPSRFFSELPRETLAGARTEREEVGAAGNEFAPGECVHHSHFGMGKVVAVKEGGEKLVIEFGPGDRKTIIPRYANMRKLARE